MDNQPLLGRRQVYVGKDVASVCDRHLKAGFFCLFFFKSILHSLLN